MFAMTDCERNTEGFSDYHVSTWRLLSYSVASDFASKALRGEKNEGGFKFIEPYFFAFHLFLFCLKRPIHSSWVQSQQPDNHWALLLVP